MNSVDISGSWEFWLDPDDVGVAQRWFEQALPESINLPGSLDENGIGAPNLQPANLGGLARKVRYTGPAWFSRVVEVPEALKKKPLRLHLERVHWFSDLWANGEHVGREDSVSVPHRYALPAVSDESPIRLTLRIDNTPHIPIGRIGHTLTDWTQTNWLGVIGKTRLEADEPLDEAPRPTRSLRGQGKQILLDGHPIFLRGTLECCVFPKTGYPPMSVSGWQPIMTKLRDFGLNHLRFHSWCPPEAAFVAADTAGILLQIELPVWTGHWPVSSDPALIDFCRREAHRILQEYGHHPSFCFMALGNEIAFYGSEPEVDRLLKELREAYSHILFTFSAHGTHLSEACDFYVQADNGKPGPANRPLRGSTWFGVGSRFDREAPNTLATCDEASSEFELPVISHEVGQWAVFPDVHNACRYDGVLEARNFKKISQALDERGILNQVPAFVEASGKLASLLYKEEVETLLRTKGLSGFQLLGLTDFPGQGTATVGLLDTFWQEKGFIEAHDFHRFCAETVPLLRVGKFVWTSDETLTAESLVFHSGSGLEGPLSWRLLDACGLELRMGELPKKTLRPGEAIPFGRIEKSLADLPAPAKFDLECSFAGHRNHWPIWIYPAQVPMVELDEVHVAPFYRQDVRDALAKGRKVWLRLNPGRISSGIAGRFAPAFWSPVHFAEQVGTMGTLIEAAHPAFDHFPTDGHTDWQWWSILTRSKALNLNVLPREYRPILQVIDRYDRNDKLGTAFEMRVGNGALLVTAIDFDQPDLPPANRQLKYSIERYLQSPAFEPRHNLCMSDLDELFSREP